MQATQQAHIAQVMHAVGFDPVSSLRLQDAVQASTRKDTIIRSSWARC